MNKECPFCWGRNTKEIAAVGGNGQAADHLMFCEECEKWSWESTGEKVEDLSSLCLTIIQEPEKCIEDVLHPLRAGYLGNYIQKTVESNLLCSECLNRNFSLLNKPASLSVGLEFSEKRRVELMGGKR